MKQLLIIIGLMVLVASPLLAQKKQFANVDIEVAFNKECNIFKNSTYTFIFLDNGQVIMITNGDKVNISEYTVTGSKVKVKKGPAGKAETLTIVDENTVKFGKSDLERDIP
jgi:hypothetical protein